MDSLTHLAHEPLADATCPSASTALTARHDPKPPHGHDERERLRRQLEDRFRHSLNSGQLSPLLHLVMRYKLGGGS